MLAIDAAGGQVIATQPLDCPNLAGMWLGPPCWRGPAWRVMLPLTARGPCMRVQALLAVAWKMGLSAKVTVSGGSAHGAAGRPVSLGRATLRQPRPLRSPPADR